MLLNSISGAAVHSQALSFLCSIVDSGELWRKGRNKIISKLVIETSKGAKRVKCKVYSI